MPEESTEVYEVAGETVTRQEWLDFKNNQNWRKTNTDEAEKLSTRERIIAAQQAELAEERRELAARRADAAEGTRPPRVTEEVEEELGELELPPLPNPIDDPVEFARVIEERDRLKDAHYRKERAADRRRHAQELEATGRTASTTAEARVAQAGAFQQNRETISGYFAKMEKTGHPVSAAEQAKLIKYMDTSLRLPEEGMGQRDRASGVFVFTEEALAAGDAYVRREYWKQQAKQEGYREAEKAGAVNGHTRDGLPLSAGKPPGPNATGQELFEYAQKLPEKVQDRYVEGLPAKQLEAFLKYLPIGLEEAAAGA